MEYNIMYQITSIFVTQVEAESEEEATSQFWGTDIRDDISNNLQDGGLDTSEIEIRAIESNDKTVTYWGGE